MYTPPSLERSREIARYARLYESEPEYRMAPQMARDLDSFLDAIGGMRLKTFLDVGCGRGESLAIAERHGYLMPRGAEVVPDLCGGRVDIVDGVHALPYEDRTFDVVTCVDVLEHVTEADAIAGVGELARVARSRVLLTVGLRPDGWGHRFDGRPLHITIRPVDWWLALAQRHGVAEIAREHPERVAITLAPAPFSTMFRRTGTPPRSGGEA